MVYTDLDKYFNMQIWYNTHTEETCSQRPQRIRLPDGLTRTNEDITDELLAQTGWVEQTVPDPEVEVHPSYVGTEP